MGQGGIHEGGEGLDLLAQLFQNVALHGEDDIRLRLSDDAPYILSSEHGAAAGAVGDESGLASGNAAHIVSHMAVADGAGIGAALDDARGAAGDAAGVRVTDDAAVFLALRLRGGDLVQNPCSVCAEGRLGVGGVDGGAVFTLEKDPQIVSADAPCTVGGGDSPGDPAAADLPGGLIASGDAPCIGAAGHLPAEGAVLDPAEAGSGDAPCVAGCAVRLHKPCDVQVTDHGSLLDVAEEAIAGPGVPDADAGYGVTVAQECAPEGRDGGEGAGGEADIVGQGEGLPPGPGVQTAVFRHGLQIFRRGEYDCGARSLRRNGRGKKGDEQCQAEEQGEDPAEASLTNPHRCQPPFQVPEGECPAAAPPHPGCFRNRLLH